MWKKQIINKLEKDRDDCIQILHTKYPPHLGAGLRRKIPTMELVLEAKIATLDYAISIVENSHVE